ncbi:MAG: ATP-binding protein [Gammaproteobacteria bacterium]|nr:ATP-binding protein [Gammaproteobacteria bacterium]
MTNWGIRKQIIALALLPVLVISIILTSYFTLSQLDFISASQVRHGHTIAQQLAPVSEYAVFSGNINSLLPILNNALSDKDVVDIKITNTNNEVLAAISDYDPSEKQASIWYQLTTEELSTFRAPIKTQTLDIEPLDEKDNTNKSDDIIGHIEITLTSININAKKLQTATEGGLVTLVIIIISIILALQLSRQISSPIQNLTTAVKKISSGDYKSRINQQAQGELGILETCVNIMAEELQSSHENLEAKVEEATKELNETMEELEVRNIELNMARSSAIASNKAKTEFLASMSHELRTPLGGILGFSELLDSTSLEPQQRDYSEIIKKSAHNLLHIIDDVLDLSKIESGKLEIHYSEFNIIDIIEDVVDLLITIAYEKDLELFYHIDKNTPHIINSDPDRVRQILINLIGNAIKFTEKGSISLHISSSQESDTSTQIIFSVVDTGIGMTASQQERLFNAFTQADKTIERKFGGTGLGLVISKKLAKLVNGDINFNSQYNKGSIFTLNISVETIKQPHAPSTILNNKNICFIDPQCCCEKGIQSMLLSWGCTVSKHTTMPDESSGCDLIIVSICRNSMEKEKIKSLIPLKNTKPPILAIVSTRSHKELIDIKNQGFTDAIFRSSKREFIHHSIANLINQDILPIEPKILNIAAPFDWSGLNVLIVDDNDINLKLAEIILTKNGAQVSTASTGQESIELSNNQLFDLIFMDLQMPDMDGYESSMLIRKNNKNTVIIALTANAMASRESSRIDQCGINDILIKPINESSIQNMIDHWLLEQTQDGIELFSKEEAKELAAGNIQLANELTNMLINELPEHLQNINDAFKNNDIEQLRLHTHKLHGATRCGGALALRNAAQLLESNIDNKILEKYESSTLLLVDEIERLLSTDITDLII